MQTILGEWLQARVCDSCAMSRHKVRPRLKPPKTVPGAVHVNVGWYTEAEWVRVKAAATDPDRFEATYEEWVRMAEESLVRLRAAGADARKAYIDAGELLAWCLAHGLPNDAGARARFVSQQAFRPTR